MEQVAKKVTGVCQSCARLSDCIRYGNQKLRRDLKTCRDYLGHIEFGRMGLIRTYHCTCGGEAEADEMGVTCYTCGARRNWPEVEEGDF